MVKRFPAKVVLRRSKRLKKIMGKSKSSTILKEKDRISSDLNTLNHGTANQGYKNEDSTRKFQVSGVPSKWPISSFSPTLKKIRKKPQTSQSNTIDIWLSKRGEEKEHKLSRKSGEHPIKRSKDSYEKENQSNEDRQIEFKRNKHPSKSVSSRSSIKDTPIHSETNTSSKHNLKLTSRQDFKETLSTSDKFSKKKSERESKNVKIKLHSPQRKLDTYLNKEDKQNKHKSDNKKFQPSTACSSGSKATRKEDSHKNFFNNNKEVASKNGRSKDEVEKSLEKQENLKMCSDSSADKKYKRIISPVEGKKLDKPIYSKSSSTALKKDIIWLGKEGKSKDKYKNRSKTKYDKLPVKISSDHNADNRDEKSKSKKRSESKTDSVRNSRDKQENLDKKYKSSRKRSRSKTAEDHDIRESFKGQEKLDNYLKKNFKPEKKRKFSRTDSNESCEFPSFKNITKKVKKPQKDDSFKKYGMFIPSVEEILKEQKDLEKYRQKIQSLEAIVNKSFELPFSVKDLNKSQESYSDEDVLDCKHLSMDEITAAFKKNLEHVSAIFHGKQFNERHEKYFNNTNYSTTDKDLCYNTSMIVFNFDQKEHMLTLLKEKFDPDDKWTPYFFQVLLPELCVRIFMDAHEMTYDEAVKYLDTRPIIDD